MSDDGPAGEVMLFTATGDWRVYFNRHQAAPLVWCVSAGHWEIAVRGVVIRVPCCTGYTPLGCDNETGKPSAWMSCYGKLSVTQDGFAIIEAE